MKTSVSYLSPMLANWKQMCAAVDFVAALPLDDTLLGDF